MKKITNCLVNKDTSCFPVWFMRQAGRYLPEFRKIRSKNPDFIKLCLNSDLSYEITLQPINRFNVESIRGVDCSGVIRNLLSKNLIKIKGRDDSPGRPLLYSTTNDFLQNFGLNRISDLPKIKEVAELTDQDMLKKMKLDSLQLNQPDNPELSIENDSATNLLPS